MRNVLLILFLVASVVFLSFAGACEAISQTEKSPASDVVDQIEESPPSAPTPRPCPDPVESPLVYEGIVLSHPVVEQLSDEFELTGTWVDSCFHNDKVGISLEYVLPTDFSQYGIAYSEKLYVLCSKNGTVELSSAEQITGRNMGKPESMELSAIREFFNGKVRCFEGKPRIQEFLNKMGSPDNQPICLWRWEVALTGGDARIVYRPEDDYIREYRLPNSISWDNYPEMEQAHRIIQENPSDAGLMDCITAGYKFKRTLGEFRWHGGKDWLMEVSILCGNETRPRWVELHLLEDGSYDFIHRPQPITPPVPPRLQPVEPPAPEG